MGRGGFCSGDPYKISYKPSQSYDAGQGRMLHMTKLQIQILCTKNQNQSACWSPPPSPGYQTKLTQSSELFHNITESGWWGLVWYHDSQPKQSHIPHRSPEAGWFISIVLFNGFMYFQADIYASAPELFYSKNTNNVTYVMS